MRKCPTIYRLCFNCIFILILLAGCKKQTEKELIIGDWKLTGLIADAPYDWNNDGVKETDLYSVFTACEKDNLLQLTTPGSGKAKDDCNRPNISIEWYTNNLVTYIEIVNSGFGGKYEVMTLNKKTLVMRKRLFLSSDYHNYTFTRQ